MESLDMELILTGNPTVVSGIVEKTIQKAYPYYYPSDAVQFFLDLHSEARIEEGMPYEEIYLVMVQGNIIGTSAIILWRKREAGILLYWKPGFQVLGEQDKDYMMVQALQE